MHRHHDRSQAQHHHGLQQDPRLVSGRNGRVRLTQEPAGQQEVRVLQHVQGRQSCGLKTSKNCRICKKSVELNVCREDVTSFSWKWAPNVRFQRT